MKFNLPALLLLFNCRYLSLVEYVYFFIVDKTCIRRNVSDVRLADLQAFWLLQLDFVPRLIGNISLEQK